MIDLSGMFEAMTGPNPREMADAVLEDIVLQRKDYDTLQKILVAAYKETFDHDTMTPLNEGDKHKRELLESILWDSYVHHKNHHAGCLDEDKTFEAFREDWSRSAFERVRKDWIEVMQRKEGEESGSGGNVFGDLD